MLSMAGAAGKRIVGLSNNPGYGGLAGGAVGAGAGGGGGFMMAGSLRRLMLALVFGGAVCAPLLGVLPAGAQAPRQAVLSENARARAVARIQAEIEAHYVFPERRGPAIARLAAAAAEGRYDTSSPALFAERVSEDLLAVTQDTHLYLAYDPSWFESAQAASARGDANAQIEVEAQIARYTNHGLSEMRILPGNIRYLRIEGFAWLEQETAPAYDSAMQFLRGGRAIILDLRGNTGGWIEASKYLLSHFLQADTLIATFHTSSGEALQYHAADYVPAGRIERTPVYILIDSRSRSAAEMVAYTFQQYRLGELIGARTAGAANVSDDFAVAPCFRLSVSTGRTVQPVSQTDWEGAGVAPTIESDPARALEVAQLRAIERLLPTTPDGVPRHQLEWARPALEAALNPVILDESALRAFVGDYGDVSIRFENGALWLHRPDRPPSRLLPMSRDLFQAADNETLRVRITPRALEVLRPDPAYSMRFTR